MKLPYELFDLGDAALVDEVAVVGLAGGDVAADRCEHDLLDAGQIDGFDTKGEFFRMRLGFTFRRKHLHRPHSRRTHVH